MMEALDAGFDSVCFIGYHCRSNTHGIMAHTIWGGMIRSIAVDGKEMGEGAGRSMGRRKRESQNPIPWRLPSTMSETPISPRGWTG